MKNLKLFAMVALMVIGLTACAGGEKESTTQAASSVQEGEAKEESAAGDAAAIDEDGVFTVGFDQDFPPMGFVGEDGQFKGFDLELAAEVAKRLGMEIKYQPIEWAAKEMEIESGSIDCIWNGFTINGREDAYTWSDPYMENKQVFVVKKESGIEGLGDLAGKSVEVQADSSAEAALKDKPDLTKSFGELRTVADYNTAFMDLEMGTVDAIAMDVIVAGYQIQQRNSDEYMMLQEELASETYGIGFKKGNTALRDAVNIKLLEMAADGTLEKVSKTWFGQDVTIIGRK
ncbi:MAG: amino acid ABC transporter substrate-binding protein [Johnsonella sp.]|nr:amino acid ABC transporter substrate-binding protein [Johnsonella sp.]